MILKTDVAGLTEENIRVDNEIVDTVVKSLSSTGKTNMSPDEIRKQAYDQLNEARNLIIGSFSGMGVVAHPLFKKKSLKCFIRHSTGIRHHLSRSHLKILLFCIQNQRPLKWQFSGSNRRRCC